MRTLIAALALGLTMAGPLAAQAGGDRWQIQLENGEYIWDIRLVRLSADTLVFRQADTLGYAMIANIVELRLLQKTTVHPDGDDRQAETMAALMGGNDEVYDLRTQDFATRLRTIQQLLLVHPPGT